MDFDITKAHCKFFDDICKIPHGSKNEKELSDYLVDFAKTRNLRYIQDELWNVIIYKDATVGYETAKPLMIQAHIDMVCEKNKSSSHDFEKDALELIVEDGILKANGTTLGADDGVGVAYMLAILADDSLVHPPLECVFTTQEEIGLIGAIALKPEYINARRMISLDGGGETNTMLSSAGGCRVVVTKKMIYEDNTDATYHLAVRGLSGGHSGGEIHKEKGNANKLMARLIKEAMIAKNDIRLVSINGGLKDNAIPRECDAIIASKVGKEKLAKAFNKTAGDIKGELEFSDAGFYIEFDEVVKVTQCMDKTTTDEIINFIYLVPNGFRARSMAIEGLTLTSLNLGVITTECDTINCYFAIRSAIESAVDDLVNQVTTVATLASASYVIDSRYPGWNYSPESELRDIMQKCVHEQYGKDLDLIAAHGGCECGVFKAMHPDMDIIMVGPVSKYIHTPDEQLDLASFDRAYALLTSIVTGSL